MHQRHLVTHSLSESVLCASTNPTLESKMKDGTSPPSYTLWIGVDVYSAL